MKFTVSKPSAELIATQVDLENSNGDLRQRVRKYFHRLMAYMDLDFSVGFRLQWGDGV